jgi:lipoprotein-anchoring transpeptidase ErfK/SrfK
MRRLTQTALASLALACAAVPANAAVDSPFPFFFAPLFQSAQPAPQARPVVAAYQPETRQPSYQPQETTRSTTREIVSYNGRQAPGTIVINTSERRLYLVMDGGRAMRYAVGVGREGFQWSGTQKITNKQEWPDWRPPAEMIQRRPDLPRYMAGGPQNPLGARALYLGASIYRIHGSNEPETIGTAVSSGCIRMLNEDVVDLYNRVKVGTQVVVLR